MSDYNFEAQAKGFDLNIDLFEVKYDSDGMCTYKDAYVELYDKAGELIDALNDIELFKQYDIDVAELAEKHDQDLYAICQKKADEHNLDACYGKAEEVSYDRAHAYD